MRILTLAAILCLPLAAATFQDVEYRNVDGKSLKLDASVPDGEGPFPTAILVHGGSWGHGDKGVYISPLFEPLTKARYVWFSIDYRLAPEFQFPAQTDDLIGAIEWVREHAAEYKVDTSRLALIGESAGGQMVGYVGAKYGEELGIAAVVDFYGPNDMVAQGAVAQKEKPPSLFAQYLSITEWNAEATEKMKAASPVTWVNKDMPAFLCVHGTTDKQVAYSQSTNFCAAAIKAGGKCLVQTIEGGDHGMGNWKSEWVPAMLAWLKKALE